MVRPTWSGYVRLSLVSIPVKAFVAESSTGRDFVFNQLHKKCHSRIRYKKVCPLHGEVSKDQIVSAYEYEKGKYVVLDDDEIAAAEAPKDRGIGIDSFIPAGQVDPLYFEGRTYYLVPDGESGDKPYALLCQAMLAQERWALAEAVLWRKSRLVLLRPIDDVLTMSLLRFGDEVRRPDEFRDSTPSKKPASEELRLAKRLIAETSVDEIDWSKYEDRYQELLTKAIDKKVAGEEVVESESEEETPVINLMDALKRSMSRSGKTTTVNSPKRKAKSKGKSHPTVSIPLRPAASRRAKPKTAKRRKIS